METKRTISRILSDEELFAFEEIMAELTEGIYTKNIIEIEMKHSVGRQLLAYPNLVELINKEAHYYVLLAKKYETVEQAIADSNLGKSVSWAKLKRKL